MCVDNTQCHWQHVPGGRSHRHALQINLCDPQNVVPGSSRMPQGLLVSKKHN